MFEEQLLTYFSDGFENGFGNWSTNWGTPTAGTVAFNGSSSYAPNEDRDEIYHLMGSQTNSLVTVRFYDDATDLSMKVRAKLSDGTNTVMLGVDTSQSTTKYAYSTGGSFIPTTINRSTGWHELKFDLSSATNCKMYIDGSLVATTTNILSFNRIILGDNTADGQTGNVYFDGVYVQ